MGNSRGLLLNIGNMKLKVEAGRGGLGVFARVPGLVKPPSLVNSAVETLLLLQTDMPRTGLLYCSSMGEAALEFDCNCRAEVRRDCCWSQRGLDFVNDDREDW